ncbi:valine--tRNA ligase [Candidatus Nomurabacteria bacterium]|nr:valine--tRNA ligase [Candidatus Nomurabacteria bacterium]
MNPENGSINVPEKLLKPYDPQNEEKAIYNIWESSGYFNPEKMISDGYTNKDAKPYTIIMPPPNVTGVLHMGHALMLTVQDILIRYKRMQGFRTLWLPGTDHAAIATQSTVEKKIMKEEKLSRHDLGREEMLKRIEEFAKNSHDTIASQIRIMGSSCDWSREAFTLDEQRTLAVRTAFKAMYEDGLIYRGHRIVNWDPKGQTTISDDEIVHEARKAKMYTFKYSKEFPIAISTTRPETKVGDVAVAVHPSDERYKAYVGKEYDADFCGVKIHIKVIADEAVEKDFGTGALGVTPAHSMVDWEMADRHDLPRPQVINEYAKMMVGDENLMGKKVTEARETIVSWLEDQSLMESEQEIDQNVSTAERTGGIIEPLPKLQWFINVNKPIPNHDNKTLKELMRDAVEKDGIKIVPEYFQKVYTHWIDNLHDWCISRQIWYGHRIPVWYKENEIYCDIEAPKDDAWKQDEDTLDTWFSSGLWTFSTLGWPNQTEDLKIYHPTSVLETGYDILPFWVSRMIMMTKYNLNTIPFETVYFHGLVRDIKGQKMSKSLGNAMDPLDVAQKYGADAGRMALVVGTAPGTDSKVSEEKIKGYKLFANKIWNITRFVLSNTEDVDLSFSLTEQDESIYKAWKEEINKIQEDIDGYALHIASEKIYHYIWDTFASTILEESKPLLSSEDEQIKKSRQKLLYTLLVESITVLHPFMPFVTESIWQLLPHKEKPLLMISKWPSL